MKLREWVNVSSRLKFMIAAAVMLFVVVLFVPFKGVQAEPRQNDRKIDALTRSRVIDAVIENIDQHYVFPDMAKAINTQLRLRQQQGAYDQIDSAEAFAEQITEDLQQLSKDKHLGARYSEQPVPLSVAADQVTAERLAEMKRLNFGLRSVERLPCNIGYFELRSFAPVEHITDRYAAALTILADTRALIIDLRRNHGGHPESVALLASYLFEQRTHLTDFYFREGDRIEQSWTTENVAGPKYGQTRAVYLLTSAETFSAAEEFAYDLKNLKRATIVGETTAGGAHPGDVHRLDDHFEMFVPSARAINPVSKTDWESVGVTPDLDESAGDALATAQIQILKGLVAVEKDPFHAKIMNECIDDLD